MAWETKPDAGSRGRQQDGQTDHSEIEDERVFDHHIDEILEAISDSAATGVSGLDDSRPQLS